MKRSSVLLVLALVLTGCTAQAPAEEPAGNPAPARTINPADDVPACETFFTQVDGYTAFVEGAASGAKVAAADMAKYGIYIATLKAQADRGTGGDVIDFAVPYDAIDLSESTGTDLHIVVSQYEAARDAIADFCTTQAGVTP